MNRKLFPRLLAFASLLWVSQARADARFGIVLGLDESTPVNNTSSALNFTNKLGIPGGGVFLNVGLGDVSEITLDALYLTRSFNDGFNDVSGGLLQGDLLYRYILGNTLHFGVGGYYASGLGNLSVGGNSTSYSSYGLNNADYGAVGSLALIIPVGSFSLVLDGRFNYGLANVATNSNVSIHYRDVVGLVGIQFGGSNSYGY